MAKIECPLGTQPLFCGIFPGQIFSAFAGIWFTSTRGTAKIMWRTKISREMGGSCA